MQLYVEQKHQAEAHDLLRLAQWHLEVELDVVQEAVSVDVLLPAGDQRYPDILQQEVVDGLRSGPAQLLPLAGSGQEDQLVSEVDLGLLLVGGEPHPKSLGPDDTTTHNFRLICNVRVPYLYAIKSGGMKVRRVMIMWNTVAREIREEE